MVLDDLHFNNKDGQEYRKKIESWKTFDSSTEKNYFTF